MKLLALKILTLTYLVFFVTMVVAILLLPSWTAVVASDFINHYVGAEILKRGEGSRLYVATYNYEIQDEILEEMKFRNITVFRSLPIVAFFLIPLTYLKVNDAYKIFLLFNLTVVGLITLFVFKTFNNINKIKPLFSFIVWIYLPTFFTLQMGQTSLILTLILLFIYYFLKKKKWFLSGLFSAMTILKTQYIISAPFFFLLAKDKRRFIKGFLLSSLAIFLINIKLVGSGSLIDYPSYIFNTESELFGSRSVINFTVYASMINSLLSEFFKPKILFLLNFVFYVSSLIVFSKLFKERGLESSFLIAVIFTVVFSVHTLSFDLSLLLVPIYILLDSILRVKRYIFNFDLFLVTILLLLPGVNFFNNTFYTPFLLMLLGIMYLLKKPKFLFKNSDL